MNLTTQTQVLKLPPFPIDLLPQVPSFGADKVITICEPTGINYAKLWMNKLNEWGCETRMISNSKLPTFRTQSSIECVRNYLGSVHRLLTYNLKWDIINGTDADDTISGRQGNDKIFGNQGQDVLSGNLNDDYLDGEKGQDILIGGDGNDSLVGGLGNDAIKGDRGNDILTGFDLNAINPGIEEIDTLTGGSGSDIFVLGDVNNTYTKFV